MSKLDVEQGDTIVLKLSDSSPNWAINDLIDKWEKMYKDQQINILVLQPGMSLDLIKTSNLDDSYDGTLRANNPALQEAWEKYQTVKGLTK